MGKIVLKSSDGKVFEVEEIAARKSEKLKRMIESGSAEPIISLPGVPSEILEKVIEYYERHTDPEKSSEEELKKFDDEFLELNKKMIIDINTAAARLETKELLDLTTPIVDGMPAEEKGLVVNFEGCEYM